MSPRMPPTPFPEEPSLHLAPGTQVGPWSVVERQGHGAYGIVYRALRTGEEHSDPVAIKLARYPWDQRFAREAELLSRIHHPSVPRLLKRGFWRPGGDAEHPFLVMEWVDGTPLYDWAQEHAPSSEQLRGLISQLARALAATHAAHSVHRDVKGDNIRVRSSDGRAMLIDFGSGHFEGATRLTWNSLPPGTEVYRSPEACLFLLRLTGSSRAWFEATAADDLFALGVTAFRLVTGQYPPELEPLRDETGEWTLVRADPRPLLEQCPRVDPLLREWILRLLSLSAEERGTAVELAEALESPATLVPASGVAPPNQAMPLAPARRWKSLRTLTAAGLFGLLLWGLQAVVQQPPEVLASCGQSSSRQPETGAAGVGDSPPSPPPDSARPPSKSEALAQNVPAELRPQQTRPDPKGKCPGRAQVAFNKACWVEVPLLTAEECTESGYALFKGKCLAPSFDPPKKSVPTASPANPR